MLEVFLCKKILYFYRMKKITIPTLIILSALVFSCGNTDLEEDLTTEETLEVLDAIETVETLESTDSIEVNEEEPAEVVQVKEVIDPKVETTAVEIKGKNNVKEEVNTKVENTAVGIKGKK